MKGDTVFQTLVPGSGGQAPESQGGRLGPVPGATGPYSDSATPFRHSCGLALASCQAHRNRGPSALGGTGVTEGRVGPEVLVSAAASWLSPGRRGGLAPAAVAPPAAGRASERARARRPRLPNRRPGQQHVPRPRGRLPRRRPQAVPDARDGRARSWPGRGRGPLCTARLVWFCSWASGLVSVAPAPAVPSVGRFKSG